MTVDVDNDRSKLARLERAVNDADRRICEAVVLAGELAGSGACEKVEGLPLDLHLGLVARMTGADRNMLLAAGQVLSTMPKVAGLWQTGQLSWGLVRGIVACVKRLSADDRAVIDARIAATWERWEGLDAYSPDRLLDAVDRAVDERRQVRSVERRETRRAQRSFVAIQPSLDGSGGSVYAELDALGLAAFSNAVDDAAPDRSQTDRDDRDIRGKTSNGDGHGDRDHSGGDGHDADDRGKTSGSWRVGRGRQRAQGLQRICEHWLAGTPGHRGGGKRGGRNSEDDDDNGHDGHGGRDGDGHGGNGPSGNGDDGDDGDDGYGGNGGGGDGGGAPRRWAKPLFLVHIDLKHVSTIAAGQIELDLPGGLLPRLTARLTDLLADDADLQAVIFDGARPLAASKVVRAASVPAATRTAVQARDRASRFPGTQVAAGDCDLHHLTPQAEGGDHHPDNLILVDRPSHLRGVHRYGWQLSLDGDTGMVTARRKRRTWRSLPPGTPLEPAPAHRDRSDHAPPDRSGPSNGTGGGGDGGRGPRDPPLPF